MYLADKYAADVARDSMLEGITEKCVKNSIIGTGGSSSLTEEQIAEISKEDSNDDRQRIRIIEIIRPNLHKCSRHAALVLATGGDQQLAEILKKYLPNKSR